MNERREHIGSPGSGVAAQNQAESHAVENAAEYRGEQNILCHRPKRQVIQGKRKKGWKKSAIGRCKGYHFPQGKRKQRNIEYQGDRFRR